MTGPTIIELEQGTDIKCPICRKTIIDENGGPTQPACAHIRFIYVNQTGFMYIDPELQKELDAEEASAKEKGECFETLDALKAHTGPDSIILEQKDIGIACGPTSDLTIWTGIRKQIVGRPRSAKRKSHRVRRG